MANINKDFLIVADLKTARVQVPSMNSYNTDKRIFNMFLKLQIPMSTNPDISIFVSNEEAVNYNVKLTVIKPKTNQLRYADGVHMNEGASGDGAIYEFNLPSEFTDQVGTYKCELTVTCDVNSVQELVTCDSFSYTIKPSVVTGLNPEIEINPDKPILEDLITRVETALGNESIHIHTNKNTLDGITPEKIKSWDDKQSKIDSKLNTLSKDIVGAINEVNNKPSGGEVDLSGYATKEELKTKVDKVAGKTLSTNDFTDIEKNKLQGVEVGANNYRHPIKHEVDIITQDSTHRFVTDENITNWNAKSNFSGSYNDLTNKPTIPVVDVTKSYVDAELSKKSNTHTHPYKANNYVPAWSEITGKPTIPTVDVDKAYVDRELSNKANKNEVLNKLDVANNLISSDVNKVLSANQGKILNEQKYDDISINGNELSMSAKGVVKKTVTLPSSGSSVEGHTHSNKTSLDKITDSKMTSWDNKLDSVPAEYITETELNAKGYLTQHQDISGKVDKITGKGLSTNDYTTVEKTKLSNIESNANNYVHPSKHNATDITQSAKHRFVSDAEKTSWNNKSNFSGNYNDLSNKPTIPPAYNLPVATSETLGGIKVGAGLSITSGVLSATGGGTADSVEWNNVLNKPVSFPPATHEHNQYLTQHQDISGKVDKVEGKSLSTNDFTNDLKLKYEGAYIHSTGVHAPSTAQKNSDITKAEIEAKLTGEISTHTHPNSGGGTSNVVPVITDTPIKNELFITEKAKATFSVTGTPETNIDGAYVNTSQEDIAFTFNINGEGLVRITRSAGSGWCYLRVTIKDVVVINEYTDFTKEYHLLFSVYPGDKIEISQYKPGYVVKFEGESKRSLSWNSLNGTVDLVTGEVINTDLSKYALKSELPTKTSQLVNDSGFITSGGSATEDLIVTNIVGGNLTLTTNKYQTTTMVDATEIILPTVTKLTEIHLFFSVSVDMTLVMPSCKWQTTPSIKANKSYELIFTYTNATIGWLGGCIEYA